MRSVTAAASSCVAEPSRFTYRSTSAYSSSSSRPEIVCSRFANSWACARSASVVCRVTPSSCSSCRSSVRSRMVVTEPAGTPRTATGFRLRVRIRSPTNTTASCCAALPVSTSSNRSSTPSSVSVRPTQSAGRPSIRWASALTSVTRSSRIEAEHALLDPGEHRLAVLDQATDLHRLQAEGLALDPAGDEQRPGDPDDARQPEVGEQVRHRGQQALTDTRVLLPDRGRPHHPPGLRPGLPEHRDVRDDRLPAGAGVVGDPRTARAAGVGGGERDAEPRRVAGVRDDDAVGVRDLDERHAREALHPVRDGDGLEHPAPAGTTRTGPGAAACGRRGSRPPRARGRPRSGGSRSGPGPARRRRRRRARPR